MKKLANQIVMMHTRSMELFLGASTFMAGVCCLLDGQPGKEAEIVSTLTDIHGGRVLVGIIALALGLYQILASTTASNNKRLLSAIISVPFWSDILYHTLPFYHHSFSPYMSLLIVVAYMVIIIHRMAVR